LTQMNVGAYPPVPIRAGCYTPLRNGTGHAK